MEEIDPQEAKSHSEEFKDIPLFDQTEISQPLTCFDFDSITMSNLKVDIDKFDGSGDYRIWRRKIRSLFSSTEVAKGTGGSY